MISIYRKKKMEVGKVHATNTDEQSNRDLTYELASAVCDCREFKTVEQLLAMGANPNERIPFERPPEVGHTMLAGAAFCGSELSVEYLLAAGADVDGIAECKFTPLMVAIYMEHMDIVDMLIKAGANVNAVNQFGRTPLMEATWIYSAYAYEAIQLLLRAGAMINASDPTGYSALLYLCRYNLCEDVGRDTLELLLRYGGDVNDVESEGNTPLMLACQYANHYSSGCSYVDPVRYILPLLQAGANVNLVNSNGMSALMLAAKYSSSNVVQLLAYRGANVSIENKAGEKALSLVDLEEKPGNAVALIYAGADVSNTNFEAKEGVREAWAAYDSIKMDLKYMCREVIRRCVMQDKFGGDIAEGVQMLGLPQLLQTYVIDDDRLKTMDA